MRAITFHISAPKWLFCKAFGRFRKSLYWGRASTLRLRDIPPQPLPGDNWVRLRPRLGGICGSDLEKILLATPPDKFARALIIEPLVLGHENVSTVVERGPAAEGVAEGLRVNVDPVIACAARGLEPCPSCREGQFCACWNVAEEKPRLGFSIGHSATVGGSWSDSFVAHRSQLIPVPANLSDEQAVLVDPLSSSVHTVLRRPPAEVDRDVLVFGCGVIGLGIVDFLRAWGFKGRVLAVARHRFQKALALHLGADEAWDRRDLAEKDIFDRVADLYAIRPIRGSYGKKILLGGVDLIYDAVGNRESVEESLRLVRPQGTVMITGMGHPRWVDWDPVTHKQITVMGSHGRGIEEWRGRRVHTYQVVHDLMAEGRFPADRLLTHIFPLEDYRTALDVLTHKGRHAAVHGAFRVSS
ncbi:MAG TPA: zinc-binding dehydrogenase [Phycisphaerae bacterium]|nr:zinc-binding dehydrogenase [Phycisphaerae bacterium]